MKGKSYIALISIFILTYLWQTIILIIEVKGEFDWWVLQASLFYSLIYTGLVTLGIVIAVLLNFTFKKEGVQHEK